MASLATDKFGPCLFFFKALQGSMCDTDHTGKNADNLQTEPIPLSLLSKPRQWLVPFFPFQFPSSGWSAYKLHKHNADTSSRTSQQTNLCTYIFHQMGSVSGVLRSAFYYPDSSGVWLNSPKAAELLDSNIQLDWIWMELCKQVMPHSVNSFVSKLSALNTHF